MTDRVLTDSKVLMWRDHARARPVYARGSIYERFDTLCASHRLLREELEHERELSDKAVNRVAQLEQEIGALCCDD